MIMKTRAQMSRQRSQDEDQLRSLIETIESLRGERFPHLDARLVEEILRLHADPTSAEAELARNLEQAVERHLHGEH